MNKHSTATRRMFLKGGALLAAPVAAASATRVLAGGRPAAELDERLGRLEDEAALRELHQSWLRAINAGERPGFDPAVTHIAEDSSAEADGWRLARDGNVASAQFDCTVALESRLPEDSTLAQMAHAQGAGVVHTTERRRLLISYRKGARGWRIEAIASRVR